MLDAEALARLDAEAVEQADSSPRIACARPELPMPIANDRDRAYNYKHLGAHHQSLVGVLDQGAEQGALSLAWLRPA